MQKLRSSSSSSQTSATRESPVRTAPEVMGKSSMNSKAMPNNVSMQSSTYDPINKPPKIAAQSKVKRKWDMEEPISLIIASRKITINSVLCSWLIILLAYAVN